MKKVMIVSFMCVGNLAAIDTDNVPHLVAHSLATPLLHYAAGYAGRDMVQVRWKPAQAFGAQATANKGFDYSWSSTSPYGNMAGLALPFVHLCAAYMLPQCVDTYILRSGDERSLLQKVASMLLRQASVEFAADGSLQLACTVASGVPRLQDAVQNFAAEIVVQQLP